MCSELELLEFMPEKITDHCSTAALDAVSYIALGYECETSEEKSLENGVRGEWDAAGTSQDADSRVLSQAVCKRLCSCLSFWEGIGAGAWVLRIISQGYLLPFHCLPSPKFMNNAKLVHAHKEFVNEAVYDLLAVCSVVKVSRDDIVVCSPLNVVDNGKKLRLIVDLRFVNSCLVVPKFRVDDLRTLAELFSPGDFMVKFDLKSAYHHIPIHEQHQRYLGFQWEGQYYCFVALPFGLATAPFVFHKVTRPLIVHWRKLGFRTFLYYDDGTAAAESHGSTVRMAVRMRADLEASGFIVNEQKSQWDPCQVLNVLGYVVDMDKAVFRTPQEKSQRLVEVASCLIQSKKSVRARLVASFLGLVQSQRLAVGPSTGLWTRSLYSLLEGVDNFEHHLHLNVDAVHELAFWKSFFSKAVVEFPMCPADPVIHVITYSDASNVAWGGYSSECSEMVAHGNFLTAEQGPTTSSTWREVRGMRCVIESLGPALRNRVVLHRSDNQNVVRVTKNGSRVPAIQREVIRLIEWCQSNCIHLAVEWIPRADNMLADQVSKLCDASDFQLDPTVFYELDQKWGPHTLDCFASNLSAQLPRFCSRFLNPGSMAVNAFTVDWSEENCWLFPPIHLIGCTVRFARKKASHCTLLVPNWPAQSWWPLVFTNAPGGCRESIVDWIEFALRPGLFLRKGSGPVLFTDGPFNTSVVVLRLCFVPSCPDHHCKGG